MNTRWLLMLLMPLGHFVALSVLQMSWWMEGMAQSASDALGEEVCGVGEIVVLEPAPNSVWAVGRKESVSVAIVEGGGRCVERRSTLVCLTLLSVVGRGKKEHSCV